MGILLRKSFFPDSTHVISAKMTPCHIEKAKFKHITKGHDLITWLTLAKKKPQGSSPPGRESAG